MAGILTQKYCQSCIWQSFYLGRLYFGDIRNEPMEKPAIETRVYKFPGSNGNSHVTGLFHYPVSVTKYLLSVNQYYDAGCTT